MRTSKSARSGHQRPLRNPVVEAGAQIKLAASAGHEHIYFCRRWAAENASQAASLVETAAAQVDQLRAWGLIPAAARTMDESIEFAVDHVARAVFEFSTSHPSCEPNLNGMSFAHLVGLAETWPAIRPLLDAVRGEARVAIAATREAWLTVAKKEESV